MAEDYYVEMDGVKCDRKLIELPRLAPRLRYLPTKNCHAALDRFAGATREYQSDASSRSPASSVAYSPPFNLDLPPPNERGLPRFDKGSLHIRCPASVP